MVKEGNEIMYMQEERKVCRNYRGKKLKIVEWVHVDLWVDGSKWLCSA